MSTLPASEFRVGIAMTCGCAAHGTLTRPGQPALVACLTHGCTEVADSPADLTGRKARCAYGGNEVPSSRNLAFFEHKPDQPFDRYYCGCFGWD